MQAIEFHSYLNLDVHGGYHIAGSELLKSIDQDIDIIDKASNVLNFCKPEDYKFKDYTVGYTPWESTDVPESWIEPLSKVDDFWTTATWLKHIFQPYVKREIFVVPHGIGRVWQPLLHHYDGNEAFTFIHVGEPALRKGGDILLDIWYKHFSNRKDVRLIVKAVGHTQARLANSEGSNYASFYNLDNVQVITEAIHPAELWQLYAMSQCMIYPSRGEGFGLIPFQALASGLPTILPMSAMGDFSHEYGIQLTNTKWVESDDQFIHPGRWLDHDEEEIVAKMEFMIENYKWMAEQAYMQAKMLRAKYSWENVADLIIRRLNQEI
jgi:glycosyltransferase involved in cell wall biosynthesis